jgi:hypothetical protein
MTLALPFELNLTSSLPKIETSRVASEAGAVKMTASEALSPSTQDEIDEAKEVAEACLRVFGKENAPELRASELINLLKTHESRTISPARNHPEIPGARQ